MSKISKKDSEMIRFFVFGNEEADLEEISPEEMENYWMPFTDEMPDDPELVTAIAEKFGWMHVYVQGNSDQLVFFRPQHVCPKI